MRLFVVLLFVAINLFGQEVKRDPIANKEISNIAYNFKYTLFDLQSDEPIFPDNFGTYNIIVFSKKDGSPLSFRGTGKELSELSTPKFKNYENYKSWAKNKGLVVKPLIADNLSLASKTVSDKDLDKLFDSLPEEDEFASSLSTLKKVLKYSFPIKFNTKSPFVLIIKDRLGLSDPKGLECELFNQRLKSALMDLSYDTSKGLSQELFFKIVFAGVRNEDEIQKTNYLDFFGGSDRKVLEIESSSQNKIDVIDGYYFVKNSKSNDKLYYTYLNNGKLTRSLSLAIDLDGNMYLGIIGDDLTSFSGDGMVIYNSGIKYCGELIKNEPIYYEREFNDIKYKASKGKFYYSNSLGVNGFLVNGQLDGYASRNNWDKSEDELVLFKNGKIVKVISYDNTIVNYRVYDNGQQVQNNSNADKSSSNSIDFTDLSKSINKFEKDMEKGMRNLNKMIFGTETRYKQKDCVKCKGIGFMKVCNTCYGKGNVYCNSCKGNGFNQQGKVCLTCGGKGFLKCGICKGKKVNVKCTHELW